MHPVGSYCTDISRCTVNRTLNVKYNITYIDYTGRFFYHCNKHSSFIAYRACISEDTCDTCVAQMSAERVTSYHRMPVWRISPLTLLYALLQTKPCN